MEIQDNCLCSISRTAAFGRILNSILWLQPFCSYFVTLTAHKYGLSCAVNCGLDHTGFGSRQRQRIFHFSTMSRPALAPMRPFVRWVKLSGPWRRHSPPSSAGDMNEWSYTSTPLGGNSVALL